MAYHVSLINSYKKDIFPKIIHHKEQFQRFLLQECNMAVKFDDKGNVECFYDKEDPSFTIFYTEGIEGEYYINTTDDNHIERLIAIAHKLNDGTRVRGDEGETYDSLEDVYIHPDDKHLFHHVNSGNSFFKNPSIRIGVLIAIIVCLIQILFFKK